MTASFRLGRIAGVGVGVNWSVLIIFGLIAWSLAAGRLPAAYPGRPGWAYAAAGLCAALVFFTGLLAHELSHAIVARRNGVPVEGITLWIFGGVARLRGEARTPGVDLRIAGVGPLVSLLIGVVFGAMAVLWVAIGRGGLVLGTLVWLAGINIMLALFNLVPAAPLDGGRLLRAGLWKWRGDRQWAAVAAARVGRIFGAVLIVFGLWLFLTGAALDGLWLAFIGWFLLGAAAAEEQQARVGGALEGVRTGDLMSRDPVTVPADLSVRSFVDDYLWQARFSAFPLVEDGRPVGLVTLNHIRNVPLELRDAIPLRQVACPLRELALAAPDEPVAELLPRLSRCAEGRALVISDDHLVGIVSPSDISRAVQRAAPHRSAGGQRF